MKPRSMSTRCNCTRSLRPTSIPSIPATSLPSAKGEPRMRTQVPLSEAPVDYGVELRPPLRG